MGSVVSTLCRNTKKGDTMMEREGRFYKLNSLSSGALNSPLYTIFLLLESFPYIIPFSNPFSKPEAPLPLYF